MTDRSGVVYESDWTLESPPTVTVKSMDGKPSVFKSDGNEKLLFLRLKSVHPAYTEYSRRVFGQEALSKTTLEHYLKNSPAFLGNVDTWRFGEKNTSGMVFRFSSLGIDLKEKRAF